MNLTPVITPKLAKSLFPDLVWSLSSKDKVIYLSFDDGPTPEITIWTLNILKQYNAKATFFCIGRNVEEYPDIFNKIISNGHSIGNHTHNHLRGWKTKTTDYVNNVTNASQLIKSKLFRPPYGQIRPKQIKQITQKGFKIIMWTVLSIDWDKSVTTKKCLKNVINNTSSGDIVVFHDSIKAANNMQYALPKVLEYFSEKGYEFKRIPE